MKTIYEFFTRVSNWLSSVVVGFLFPEWRLVDKYMRLLVETGTPYELQGQTAYLITRACWILSRHNGVPVEVQWEAMVWAYSRMMATGYVSTHDLAQFVNTGHPFLEYIKETFYRSLPGSPAVIWEVADRKELLPRCVYDACTHLAAREMQSMCACERYYLRTYPSMDAYKTMGGRK